MTTKTYEQLDELYVETLAQNAYYKGAAGTVADAVIAAAGCGGDPDGPDLIRAAHKLTNDAMGFVERCLSWVSNDWFEGGADWRRINAFFIPLSTESWEAIELSWVIEALKEQGDRAWRAYFDLSGDVDKVALCNRVGHYWHHDLSLAATFFQAAALLLQEGSNG